MIIKIKNSWVSGWSEIKISPEDLEYFNELAWRVNPSGYVQFSEWFLHKCIAIRMGLDIEGKLIDHKDRDTLNNQRENLRVATHTQNMANRGIASNNTSGYKGVTLNKRTGKWAARVGKDHLGAYSTAEEAAQIYNNAARERYGEFAFQNLSQSYDLKIITLGSGNSCKCV